MGQDEDERSESITYRPSPLMDVLRTEEAEGRATPPSMSNAPTLGGVPVPQLPKDDTSDDRASQDLTTGPLHAPANARQHGGDHYKGVGYEHWDLVLDTNMNYFQGCATKYVTRARKHEAGCRLNILKAIHYVDKLGEAAFAGRIGPAKRTVPANAAYSSEQINEFAAANQLSNGELQIIRDIIAWRLDQAREGLKVLLGDCPEQEPRADR